MAQRIVDVLEVIEIEEVLGHHGAGSCLTQRLLQLLAKQRAIGQARERIVQGQ